MELAHRDHTCSAPDLIGVECALDRYSDNYRKETAGSCADVCWSYGLPDELDSSQILRVIALSAAAQLSVEVVGEFVCRYFSPFHYNYRFAGTLPANSEGYMCLALTLAAICVVKANERDRWIYKILAVYGLMFLLLTRSRGVQAALGLALLFYVMVTFELRRKLLVILLSGAVLVGIILSGKGPGNSQSVEQGGRGQHESERKDSLMGPTALIFAPASLDRIRL